MSDIQGSNSVIGTTIIHYSTEELEQLGVNQFTHARCTGHEMLIAHMEQVKNGTVRIMNF